MATPPQKPGTPLPLEIPPDLEPAYANLARLSHTPTDFVLDFARLLPGDARATVTARVLMAPLGTKLFLQALTENVARYEAAFGPISLPSGSTLADHLFRPPQGPGDPPSPDEKK